MHVLTPVVLIKPYYKSIGARQLMVLVVEGSGNRACSFCR